MAHSGKKTYQYLLLYMTILEYSILHSIKVISKQSSSQMPDWIEILLIVFKGIDGNAPTYSQEMITPSKSKRYSIRSNEECAMKVPKSKHDTYGKRALAVYGHLSWNCLPKGIRVCNEIEAFKRNLKTHLFVKFVNESPFAIWFWRIIVKLPRMLSAQFVVLYTPCKPNLTYFQMQLYSTVLTSALVCFCGRLYGDLIII